MCLFAEDAKSLDRLPTSGIVQNGQLYPLEIWEPVISDEDGLLLPTPTAQEPGKIEIDRSRIDPKKGINQRFYTKKGIHTQRSLSRLADWGVLPILIGPEHHKKKETLMNMLQKIDTGEREVLSPLFVEWMMGFPIGWTDLEP